MIKFFKKMIETDGDVKVITIEYRVDKHTIKSSVQFFHNAMEILAQEAVRYIEHAAEKFPALELKFTHKYKPVSVFVVTDEFGSPLEKVKELQSKVIAYAKQVQKMAETEMDLRRQLEHHKRVIGEIITDGTTKLTRETNNKSETGEL